jgi:hypothetical protein
MQSRHHHIEDEHVGPETLDQADDLQSVARLADDVKIGVGFQHRAQALANHPMVVGQNDRGFFGAFSHVALCQVKT